MVSVNDQVTEPVATFPCIVLGVVTVIAGAVVSLIKVLAAVVVVLLAASVWLAVIETVPSASDEIFKLADQLPPEQVAVCVMSPAILTLRPFSLQAPETVIAETLLAPTYDPLLAGVVIEIVGDAVSETHVAVCTELTLPAVSVAFT